MTTATDFQDNIKPLTDHKLKILDAYIATHTPDQVSGYLDGIADVMEFIMLNVVANVEGNFRPLSSQEKTEKLKQLNALCNAMIENAPSRLAMIKTVAPSNDGARIAPQ